VTTPAEVDADVVVAGAGAAGCAAALAAAERGLSVVLLDARETFLQGSNTAMSTSMVPAGGSRWQAEAGIDDSPRRFADDVARKTHGTADPVITAALTGVAPDLVAWLADACGVPLSLVTDFSYPGHSRDRCHAVPDRAGRTLHRHLLDAVEARPEITLAVPMRLVDVQLGAAAVSAVVTNPDGDQDTVRTLAVVLATNGYAANPDLVRRHAPEIAGAMYFGGDASTGDALLIGERLGADTGYLDAYQGHGSVAVPHGILVTWATVMHGGLVLNAEGRRFDDETVGYSEYGAKVLAQPGGTAHVVLDGRIDAACRPFADYQDLLSADAIRWADGEADLAGLIGCDEGVLRQTLHDAQAAARGEAADPFGRKGFAAPLEPPYGAVKVTGALFHTQGGLLVDGDARVLRGGEPIPGLYAAGGAAAGMSGHGAAGYLAGNGLLAALGLGYLAGRDVDR
jgi:fumarate reductase flavoprotein subunit